MGAEKPRWEYREQYPCDETCFDFRGNEDFETRCRLRCSLPGFPRDRWGPPVWGAHMGHPEVFQEMPEFVGVPSHLVADPTRIPKPPEPHHDGCPGGWYRTEFCRSLLRYERRFHGDAGFSDNILLTRCQDPLVLESIRFYEIELLACRVANEKRRA